MAISVDKYARVGNCVYMFRYNSFKYKFVTYCLVQTYKTPWTFEVIVSK